MSAPTTSRQCYVETSVGSIAVYCNHAVSDAMPVIFLHGVYFDHHLWDYQVDRIHDRTTISIDMPMHGMSRGGIPRAWTLNDCANMLIEILDQLGIERVVAVGHSWGSMTIVRAAYNHPDRFAAIALCNMPYREATTWQKLTFKLNHTMLRFRDFYTRQAAKALFSKTYLREQPSLLAELKRPMDILTNAQIQQVDKAVIIDADDASDLLASLKVKAVALKGEEDYVPTPPTNIETVTIKGGHVSPLEQPEQVLRLIPKLTSFDTHKR